MFALKLYCTSSCDDHRRNACLGQCKVRQAHCMDVLSTGWLAASSTVRCGGGVTERDAGCYTDAGCHTWLTPRRMFEGKPLACVGVLSTG